MISLQPGTVLDNKQLTDIFKCSPQGGMRKSNSTDSLVLVSHHLKALYDDRWMADGTFHYTGMGTAGDQSLEFMQNKTLAHSNDTNINIYLFEVFEEQKYTYVGEVYLAAKPYQEQQLDIKGNSRFVWIFPLKIKNGKIPQFDKKILQEYSEKKEKKVKRLSDAELLKRAQNNKSKVGVRNVQLSQYERDPYVSEFAKRKAKGICQLCNQQAPFNNAKGEPYLETHHIVWLSKGGEDSIQNTVALCPNCHRKMHIVNSESDQEYLLSRIKK